MISFPKNVHPIHPYSMDLICQTFPHLQDVWKHHLKPFILPSKEEMDRRRFIVQFALHRIFERRRTRRLRASHDAWKTTHTWYIQPGVIFCSARWFNSRQVPSSSFTIYSMLGNGSMCCQTLSVVSDDRDTRMISRFVYTYGNVNGFTLLGDGEIHHQHNDDDGVPWIFQNEVPRDVLNRFCPHIRYYLLMHAIRHSVRTLRHVE